MLIHVTESNTQAMQVPTELRSRSPTIQINSLSARKKPTKSMKSLRNVSFSRANYPSLSISIKPSFTLPSILLSVNGRGTPTIQTTKPSKT